METATPEELQEALDELSGSSCNDKILKECYKNQLRGVYTDDESLNQAADSMIANGGGTMEKTTKAQFSAINAQMDDLQGMISDFPSTLATATASCATPYTASMAPATMNGLKMNLKTMKMCGIMILSAAIMCGFGIPKAFVQAIKSIGGLINKIP